MDGSDAMMKRLFAKTVKISKLGYNDSGVSKNVPSELLYLEMTSRKIETASSISSSTCLTSLPFKAKEKHRAAARGRFYRLTPIDDH